MKNFAFVILLQLLSGIVSAQTGTPPDSRPVSIHSVSYVDTDPDSGLRAQSLLLDIAKSMKTQPELIDVEVIQEAQRSNHFMLVETWRTVSARSTFRAGIGYRQFRSQLLMLLASPLDEREGQALMAYRRE